MSRVDVVVCCCNEECGWAGPVSKCRMLGGIGPLCPECGEVVDTTELTCIHGGRLNQPCEECRTHIRGLTSAPKEGPAVSETTTLERFDLEWVGHAHVSERALVPYEEGDWVRFEDVARLQAENERLRGLVEVLLENDPNDMAADAVTVMDAWRRDARRALTGEPTPQGER